MERRDWGVKKIKRKTVFGIIPPNHPKFVVIDKRNVEYKAEETESK
jgi:hypothetical protein